MPILIKSLAYGITVKRFVSMLSAFQYVAMGFLQLATKIVRTAIFSLMMDVIIVNSVAKLVVKSVNPENVWNALKDGDRS